MMSILRLHHCLLCLVCLAVTSITPRLEAADVDQKASCTALEAITANTAPDEVYKTFNRFCLAHFRAGHEALIQEVFGKQLRHRPGGDWIHVSQRSAAIGFESSHPALSHVEYGLDRNYGQQSAPRERPFSIHLHYLSDLQPDTVYHYRPVLIDDAGNAVHGPDATFQTKAADSMIPFPGDQTEAPYVINQSGTYCLTQDLNCEQTAIIIEADDVVLDLGGHTVQYANKKAEKGHFEDKWMSYVRKGFFGIKAIGHKNIRILNGKILQGAASNRGNNESAGFNPLYLRDLGHVELAGLEVDYHTPQCAGIRNRAANGPYQIHHNLIRDRGTKMHNRHGSGCASIDFIGAKEGYSVIYHHNLVARTRQNGLRGSPIQSYRNEIYVDSWATNSFAVSIAAGHILRENKIYATGYHAIAVPWGDGITVRDNFILMQGINTGKKRWWEGFGDQNSMNGLRHTQWGKNKSESTDSLYEHNIVCINGRHGAQIRGVEFFSDTYIQGLTLKDSIIKVIAQDEQTNKATCVATHGNPRREDTQNPVYYKNNTFISNINIIRIGDDYGKGSHHHFFDNTFKRLGDHPDFSTFTAMGTYVSRFHRFVDTRFGPGTAADDVDWTKTKAGSRNYDIEWTLTIKAAAGDAVTITDATGDHVYRGTVDDAGQLQVPLKQMRMSRDQRTLYTPHIVTCNGQDKTVTMDQARSVNFINN